MELQSGQNVALGAGSIHFSLSGEPSSYKGQLDLCVFLLTESGRVTGDDGFIFYGHMNDAAGAATLQPALASVVIDTARLNALVTRLVVAVSIDVNAGPARSFGQFTSLTVTARTQTGEYRFPLVIGGMSESALILAELYLRNGAWKLRALGHGFAGGLAPLAKNYGVDVQEAAKQPSTPPPSTPHPGQPTPSAPTAQESAPKRIDLRKRQPVSLEKPTQGFGEIKINLNWSRGQVKRGFFGKPKGGIDLDLGCLVELVDGKFVVQALGNAFGRLDGPPFTKLLGDDRSGESASGEIMLINGKHWQEFKRVLVYAFIYEGVPNWSAADGVVTVTAPGIPELIVRLDESAVGQNMCGIAMLENDAGRIRITKLVEYYTGHDKLDKAHGFGFKWVAGHK